MRYLIQLALVAALATGLALAQSSPGSSQQPSSSSGSQTSPSSPQSDQKPDQTQTSPSSTQPDQKPDQTQTQPSTTQPSTSDKDKDKDTSKMPQGETSAASSTDVESTIQQAIQKDPSLANSNIQVKATNKEVDLSGTVSSNDEKKTAEQIAKTNAGSRKVKNHIKVKSSSTTSPSTGATPK